ncbi:hypothetical protein TNCV_4652851 [Trichonephila clavipes]|nr:hypothetical protein TNCV_4652851 [Trichonephila clavipes]
MALSTVVDLYIEGKVISTEFLVLPDAKGNKTLLGLDFLNAAGIVLDVQGGKWHFSGNPRKQYKFFKKTLEDITLSAFELREDEGKNLSPEQARKINILLDRNEACFQPGVEPTPYIEHRIDTGDHAPIAMSPYSSVSQSVGRAPLGGRDDPTRGARAYRKFKDFFKKK